MAPPACLVVSRRCAVHVTLVFFELARLGRTYDCKASDLLPAPIAGNVSLHCLTALQQALGDEIKAIKAAQKPPTRQTGGPLP